MGDFVADEGVLLVGHGGCLGILSLFFCFIWLACNVAPGRHRISKWNVSPYAGPCLDQELCPGISIRRVLRLVLLKHDLMHHHLHLMLVHIHYRHCSIVVHKVSGQQCWFEILHHHHHPVDIVWDYLLLNVYCTYCWHLRHYCYYTNFVYYNYCHKFDYFPADGHDDDYGGGGDGYDYGYDCWWWVW